MSDVANWIWQIFSWNFQDSGFNLDSLAFSDTCFRLINFSDALNLVKISFFSQHFSKSCCSGLSYWLPHFVLLLCQISLFIASFKYPCSWIYRWKSVRISAILVIKTWHFNLEVSVSVDWGKKLLWATSDEEFCGLCHLYSIG